MYGSVRPLAWVVEVVVPTPLGAEGESVDEPALVVAVPEEDVELPELEPCPEWWPPL